MHTRAPCGFTLIELVIATAIVALLSAVALPRYQEYLRRSARAEAKAGLLQAAQWLERAATASGVYPSTAANGANFFPASLRSVPSRRYTLALSASSPGTFTLTATPQNAQQDDACGAFTLDHSGVRSNTGLAATTTSAACWNR